MNRLNEKKKKLELEQNPSIQSDEDEAEVEEDIDIKDIEEYDDSFLDPSAEEIDMESDMADMLKDIDDEWSALVK